MFKLNQFRKKCHEINLKLSRSTLQFQTFGNVSQRIDKDYYVIKPSGVNLEKTKFNLYPVIKISSNKVVEGKLKPSTDTPTHTEIYKMSENIKGITHAHSKYVTAWSQSLREIPAIGTTHADYWGESIPITKQLSKKNIKINYEKNVGLSIVKIFKKKHNLDKCPGVLVANHAGFCWGVSAEESYLNFERLEFIANLAYKSLTINKKTSASKNLIERHFNRKNGKQSYYGQKKFN